MIDMLRIFQTGDNHIGMKYASHEKGAVLSQKRIDAFENMVKTANDNDCHLFVITGDLFENTYGIAKKDIVRIVDILGKFKGTVAVLPGNHDYYDPDSRLWKAFESEMRNYDNIMLLNDYRPYLLCVNDEAVVLYPAFCRTLHSAPDENNLGFIKNENIVPDEKYRIGLAHGAVEGETIDSEGRYFFMRRSELEEVPVDVWLIGHTHVPFPKNLNDDFQICTEKIFNSGTHVQTDVSCNTEGLCFIIELEKQENHTTVKAKKFHSGTLRFYRKNLVLTAEKAEEILAKALNDLDDDSVVELIISGSVTADEYARKDELLGSSLARFTESRYDDCKLSRLISKQLIDAQFPETSFSAAFLTALLDDPKQAQLAYDLLKTLKSRKDD
ncbi:MAG: exonuclease SbcCD subunit D [Acutalibacteraceae bacterium]